MLLFACGYWTVLLEKTHCKGNPQFNFHNWYLWKFVVIFLLLNVAGWHAYFCIAFVPFILQYKFDSCVMGKCLFIIPRLVIGVECLFLGTLTSMELVHL
ncbi:hypothetical protein LINPERPRIM_LOCUS228 [Linum perenne]